MRGATFFRYYLFGKGYISTHTPHAGCDIGSFRRNFVIFYFNSHTPCGVRHYVFILLCLHKYFNSHTPCGVRPNATSESDGLGEFQLTHPMRGATRQTCFISFPGLQFQLTHPMRGATYGIIQEDEGNVISTHTPHAGCDQTPRKNQKIFSKFQLTHPMRGATETKIDSLDALDDFNSHTPCGVRLTPMPSAT